MAIRLLSGLWAKICIKRLNGLVGLAYSKRSLECFLMCYTWMELLYLYTEKDVYSLYRVMKKQLIIYWNSIHILIQILYHKMIHFVNCESVIA